MIMEEHMVPIREPKNFYFGFNLLKDVHENSKQERLL